MTKAGHTPVRTCVGCRRTAAPDELVRLVVTSEGGLAIGRSRPGRGAWVCPGTACFDRAVARRALGRALRTAIPTEAIAALRPSLEHDTLVGPPDDVRESSDASAGAST